MGRTPRVRKSHMCNQSSGAVWRLAFIASLTDISLPSKHPLGIFCLKFPSCLANSTTLRFCKLRFHIATFC